MSALRVVRLAGIATVQDGGRAGRMHEGVPPGGALVPERLAAANRAVGNPRGAAAIEIAGAARLAAEGARAWISLDGAPPRALDPGEAFDVAPGDARARYVAARGGIDVPLVLGGRGTLLVAQLGGFEGRVLRRGDVLGVGAAPGAPPAIVCAPPRLDPGAPVRVVLGPDLERFAPAARETLLAARFEISAASDRVGTRLTGASLAPADAACGASAPMVRGALQVPPSGEPIVLGPDHPTTGGYPVIATVIRADFGAIGARRPGAAVRFVAVSAEEARRALPESGA